MRQSALKYILDTFFDGSPEQVVAALLGKDRNISRDQLERIAKLIEQARKEGPRK
jgi:hypothetical protein